MSEAVKPTSDLNKQEQVFELVKAGTFTRKEIIEKVGCTTGAFASYLSTMRMAANSPASPSARSRRMSWFRKRENPDRTKRVFTCVSFEESEKAKEERAANAAKVLAKTPAERKAAAEKRVEKCQLAEAKAKANFDANTTSEELDLRYQLAKIETRLAQIALDNLDVEDITGADAESTEPEATGEVVPESNEELL